MRFFFKKNTVRVLLFIKTQTGEKKKHRSSKKRPRREGKPQPKPRHRSTTQTLTLSTQMPRKRKNRATRILRAATTTEDSVNERAGSSDLVNRTKGIDFFFNQLHYLNEGTFLVLKSSSIPLLPQEPPVKEKTILALILCCRLDRILAKAAIPSEIFPF
jgi:hypothetical protein